LLKNQPQGKHSGSILWSLLGEFWLREELISCNCFFRKDNSIYLVLENRFYAAS
jgi:hypothetical protein